MKSKPGKEGRVVREPAPAAAAERQRLVRDARCARVSSASSAPTPAPRGAFPLVRHHCHHQFAPPGASPGVNSRSPTGSGAYIVTTPVRCSLTDCIKEPCWSNLHEIRALVLLWQEECTNLVAPQSKFWKPARAQIRKRGHWALSRQDKRQYLNR